MLEALETDWLNDSHGDGEVDEVDFEDAVFELARTWSMDMVCTLSRHTSLLFADSCCACRMMMGILMLMTWSIT